MKLNQFLAIATAMTALGHANLHAEEAQPQMTFTKGASSTWNADWDGVTQRTYFLQYSLDLMGWSFAPNMRFDIGSHGIGVDTQNADKFFVRLKYMDAEWVVNLQEAEDADFDNDGLPNKFEVDTIFSDPFDKDSAGGDTDSDGLPDGWELFYFGDLVTADPNAKNSTDGLTNKEKAELGLGPDGDDPNLTTERIEYTYDGERLEGVNYYTQRDFDYTLDGNGNVEATTSGQ